MREGLWTSWVSRRFLVGRRGGRGSLVLLLSILLIAGGVGVLNTILAVMNGLQQGYIRSILEIGSYHLRWRATETSSEPQDLAFSLAKIFADDSSVSVAIPFQEGQTLFHGIRPRPLGALVRGVPKNLLEVDKNLSERLRIVEGNFDISNNGVVLGYELAFNLGVSPGDEITALSLAGFTSTASELSLRVTGVFRCRYRDYESSLAFSSLENVEKLFGPALAAVGIKLHKLDHDRRALLKLQKKIAGYGGELTSWRETNRAFFGALRTEKIMMILLLTLIFVVVAVNIDHALRRMATERKEELAILKALGASPFNIRLLFLKQSLAIGGMGALTGSILGILIGGNVGRIVNAIKFFWRSISSARDSNIFPLQTYANDVFFRHSEVMFVDVFLVFGLAILIAALAGLRAASMAASLKPAEVLRSE